MGWYTRVVFSDILGDDVVSPFLGDELCLYALSHMWGVGITLLYPSENNRQHKIRHSMPLSDVHFALLYTGHAHYSLIGKSRQSP